MGAAHCRSAARPDDAMRLHDIADQAARCRRARGRDRRCPLPCARGAAAAGCRHRASARVHDDRRARLSARAARRPRTSSRPEEMERRFAAFPDAIAATADIAGALHLRPRRARLPISARAGARWPDRAGGAGAADRGRLPTRMFPDGVPTALRRPDRSRAALIGELGYAPYFLTVNAIVAEGAAARHPVPGAGSAANCCVCFVLGITSHRSDQARAAVRAVRLRRTARAARHRRRFRA